MINVFYIDVVKAVEIALLTSPMHINAKSIYIYIAI